MGPWASRLTLGVGAGAAIIVAPLGLTAQGGLLMLATVVMGTSIAAGLKSHEPECRGPWRGLIFTSVLLFVAAVMRGFGLDTSLGPLKSSDYVSMLAYATAIANAHRLLQLRSRRADPTSLFDALSITAAVGIMYWVAYTIPYLNDDANSLSARVSLAVFCSLDIAMCFALARLAIGPGARNVSWYLLAVTTSGTLVSDVIISSVESADPFVGASVLALLITTCALFACAAAALHPSMVQLTSPALAGVPRMTRTRLGLMMASAVLPVSVVVLREGTLNQTDQRLFPGAMIACGIVTLLILARFVGITFAKERAADLDRALAAANVALASAGTLHDLSKAAAAQTVVLVNAQNVRLTSVSMMLHDSQIWAEAAACGPNGSVPGTAGLALAEECLELLNLAQPQNMDDFQSLEKRISRPAQGDLLALPLLARGSVRGCLVVQTERAMPADLYAGLRTWVSQIAGVLEAAVLAEAMHRQRSERRFRSLVERSADLIVVIHDRDGITFVSPAAERLLGGRKGDFRAFLAAVDVRDRSSVLGLFQRVERSSANLSVECRLRDPDGELLWFELTASDLRDDPDVDGVVLNAHNITERRGLEENLRHQVLHDSLTGIGNRVLFRDRVQHSLASRVENENIAVLFLDLDDFKTVNDSLGPGVGDEILRVVAFRLESYVRAEDTVARLGGDEFAVLLGGSRDSAGVLDVAERLLEVIAQPVDFGNRTVTVTSSIGVAFRGPDDDADVLLRNADAAMYDAKSNGKRRLSVFDQQMYERALERLEVRADLARALERNEMYLNFQPIVTFANDSTVAFEALLRWNHGSRGFIGPDVFIPLAEETGLIVELGEWVLREAVRAITAWEAAAPGAGPVSVSVNVSPKQLEDDSFVAAVKSVLVETGVSPAQLTMELTETSLLSGETAKQRLEDLRQIGVGIAADDFGSGFASYAALQRLPFTTVKLDKSLVDGIAEDGRASAQVESIIRMAHKINLLVVAEGIEESRQRDELVRLGCDKGQGYFFSRPMTFAKATDWIKETVTLAVR